MKRFITTIGLVLIVFTLKAQSLDSLRVVFEYESSIAVKANILYKLAYYLNDSSPDEADSLIHLGIALAQQSNEVHLTGKFYALSGYQQKQQLNYKEAFLAFAKAIPWFEEAQDKFWVARCYQDLAELKIVQGDNASAKEDLRKAYALYVETESWSTLANLQYRFGEFAYSDGNYDEARTNFQLALAYYTKEGNYLKQAELNEHLGMTCYKEDNLQGYENYLQIANSILSKVPEETGYAMQASLCNNFGILEFKKGNITTAIEQTKKALTIAQEHNNSRLILHMANNLASLLIKDQEYATALPFLDLAFQVEPYFNSTKEKFRTYKFAVQAHSALGNWEQALALEEERNALEVSEEQMNAAELKAQQAAAISMAQAELEVEAAQAEVQEARQRTWIIVGSILLACILIAYLFYRRMAFYRKEAWRHATNWPELQRKMDALEETLGMMG